MTINTPPAATNLFKGFKGIIEIRHTLTGRIRFFIPALKDNIPNCSLLMEQLQKITIIHNIEINPITGSLLILFEEDKLDQQTLTGAIIKLLGLETNIEKDSNSVVGGSLTKGFTALNVSIRENTNGVLDMNSVLTLGFIALGIRSFVLKQAAFPSGFTLLYWAYQNMKRQ